MNLKQNKKKKRQFMKFQSKFTSLQLTKMKEFYYRTQIKTLSIQRNSNIEATQVPKKILNHNSLQ